MSDDKQYREDIYSSAVRAGKRTYFFDVRATRGNDLYLTITESKRRYQDDGRYTYEKHKLFLYKEDFEKFEEGLMHAVDKIKELQDSGNYSEESPLDRKDDAQIEGIQTDLPSEDAQAENIPVKQMPAASPAPAEGFSDVSFDDLED